MSHDRSHVSPRRTGEHFCQCVGVHLTSSCAKSCACSPGVLGERCAISGATSYERIVIIYFDYWWIIIYRLIHYHTNHRSSDFNNWLLTDLIFRKNGKMPKKSSKSSKRSFAVHSQTVRKTPRNRRAMWRQMGVHSAIRRRPSTWEHQHRSFEGRGRSLFSCSSSRAHLLSSPHRDGWTRIKKVHVFTHRLANECFERKTSAACVCMYGVQSGGRRKWQPDHGIITFSSDFAPRTHRNTYFRWWRPGNWYKYINRG